MPRTTYEEKYSRTLKFLMAFQNNRVRYLMSQRGFDQNDLNEGWDLFILATGRSLSMADINKPLTGNAELVTRVDEWENIWFDVADAALKRHYPEIHEKLFLNLKKTEGLEVIANVKAFVIRLFEIRATNKEPENSAIALLAKRGLDNECIKKAEMLLEQSQNWEEPTNESGSLSREKMEEARKAMWGWYTDWAQTARTVIGSKRLRILMGLSTQSKTTSPESEAKPDSDADTE